MTLGDDLIAACGSPFDSGDIIKRVVAHIKQAQRFVLSDEVVKVCSDLTFSRPSTMNAALPMCRLPYKMIWVENRGGLGEGKETPARPFPLRQGALVESLDPGGQVGIITIAWVHRDKTQGPGALAPTVCPFSIFFDWRPNGDVTEFVDGVHDILDKKYKSGGWVKIIRKTISLRTVGKDVDFDSIQRGMRLNETMKRWADDPKEVEAVVEAQRRIQVGIGPYGLDHLIRVLGVFDDNPVQGAKFLDSWIADTAGEALFVEVFLTMLNSRNPCIEQLPTDLRRLNKHRIKAGKPPFLDHIETRIALSRKQQRQAARGGLSYEQIRRGTTVMGHFKIRRTGVFWWSAHERGDQANRVDRKQYEVVA